ncbi:hypothetical protein BDR26DRAFT_849120 [Obelidium mucronatum]|nr:hypothetical protein BDR26DRAFT_849120 [Obelidium mucronatum]
MQLSLDTTHPRTRLALAAAVSLLALVVAARVAAARLAQPARAREPKPRRLDIDIDLCDAVLKPKDKPRDKPPRAPADAGAGTSAPDMARQMTANPGLALPPSLQLQLREDSPADLDFDPAAIRRIVDRLLEVAPEEPPTSAFKNAIAGLSGKPAVGSGSSIAVRESTGLPPFHAQIAHIVNELKSAKQPGRPVLIEGPPGLGKGTALRQYMSDEGSSRPAVYLQLSNVLRKRHGASSLDEDDEDDVDSVAFTETDTEVEGEEKVLITVKRDAWVNSLLSCLGYKHGDLQPVSKDTNNSMYDESSSSDFIPDSSYSQRPAMSLLQRQLQSPTYRTSAPLDRNTSSIDMRPFTHIAQALRLIASRSKAGPCLLVIDDIQLLFRERIALTDRYDGIPEVFEWLLKCQVEGILDVTFCSSEKSAVGAIKRLRGYDWAIKLHAVESVEDDTVISYLMNQVNPCIKDASRRFTEETASLFVATFDGSLLELDLYFRDTHCPTVHAFIAKRERSFLRRLQKHLPSRISRRLNAISTQNNNNSITSPTGTSISTASGRTSTTITAADYLNSYTYRPPQLSTEEELRELFLDIMMRGGVLPVAQLSLARMSLVESLVERNILRWRDSRIRKRENRAMHRRESTSGGNASVGSGSSVGGGGSGTSSGFVSVSPNAAGIGKKQRVFGATTRNDGWFGMTPAQQAMAAPSWGTESEWDSVGAGGGSVAATVGDDDWGAGGIASMLQTGEDEDAVVVSDVGGSDGISPLSPGMGHDLSMDNQWAGANSKTTDGMSEQVKNMDAAEQLALFAMEDAELVWSNHLVRNVCEGFVSGTQMQW